MNTVDDYNAWNPGLILTIPPHLLPLITLFLQKMGQCPTNKQKKQQISAAFLLRHYADFRLNG